jgi:hypothetical protein
MTEQTQEAPDLIDRHIDEACDLFEMLQTDENFDTEGFESLDYFIQGYLSAHAKRGLHQDILAQEDNSLLCDAMFETIDQIESQVSPKNIDGATIALSARYVSDLIELTLQLLKDRGYGEYLAEHEAFFEAVRKHKTPFRTPPSVKGN